jgi:hypothetical protein
MDGNLSFHSLTSQRENSHQVPCWDWGNFTPECHQDWLVGNHVAIFVAMVTAYSYTKVIE